MENWGNTDFKISVLVNPFGYENNVLLSQSYASPKISTICHAILIWPNITTVSFISRFIRNSCDPKHYTQPAYIFAFCSPSQQIPIPKLVKPHFLAFRPPLILLLSIADYTLTHSTRNLILSENLTPHEMLSQQNRKQGHSTNWSKMQIISLTTHCLECRIMQEGRKIDI